MAVKNPHEKWMSLALALAEKGKFTTSPNPVVGACVIKNNRLAGTGYHALYGGDHAEVIAIRHAGKKAKGATLYLTLEPCSTWGKTPPCVNAILEAGIKKVVVAALDPNPRHQGEGIRLLRKAGLQVVTGVLVKEAEKQNEAFFKTMKKGLPFVTLKMAQSLDGKIATREGNSRWITSPKSRDFVHRLRAEQDAILVGHQTFLRDNPKLSPRKRGQAQKTKSCLPPFSAFGKPWRVFLDSKAKASPRARIFEGDQLTFQVISNKYLPKLQSQKMNGQSVIAVRETKGRLDLKELLKKLADLGVAKLLVEGGGELAWSLLKEGLVDKAYWIVAPKIIGGRSAKTSVEGDGIIDLNKSIRPKQTKVSQLGEDWLIETRF